MRKIILLMVFSLLICSPGFAGTPVSQRESLEGVGPVEVVVSMGQQKSDVSLSEHGLKASIELRLRSLGISVADNYKKQSAAYPFLWVSVRILSDDKLGVNVYSVAALFAQLTTSKIFPNRTINSTTWYDTTNGWAGDQVARDGIKESLLELVDRFANDYLAMNPLSGERKVRSQVQ